MANKKDVIKELYRTLNLSKVSTAARAKDELEKLITSKHKLDDYAIALHTNVEKIDRTPFELLSELSMFDNLKDF